MQFSAVVHSSPFALSVNLILGGGRFTPITLPKRGTRMPVFVLVEVPCVDTVAVGFTAVTVGVFVGKVAVGVTA